jgi:hypothetical protein
MKRRDLLLLRTTSVRNMEKELTYRSVFPVLESCDMLCRRVPNYQDEVGGKLFLKCVQRNATMASRDCCSLNVFLS